jgi:hypothetical protein
MIRAIAPLIVIVAAFVFSVFGGDALAGGFLLLIVSAVTAAAGIVVAALDPQRQRRWLNLGLYLAAAAVVLVVARTHFPFRAAFSLTRGSLERLAQSVKDGDDIDLPRRAGIYTIRAVGKKGDGSVYLWRDPDPAGPGGFVRGYTGAGYNIWSESSLGHNWHYIVED